MSRATATCEVLPDGCAIVTLVNPPVNSLHPDLLNALVGHVRQAQADPRVKAIVVTGTKNFSAGFDIPQFIKLQKGTLKFDDLAFGDVASLLETGPKPTVAAICGNALGGGLEVAMTCNSRICTPEAAFGLPELSLGTIPGAGGTQRLPRLIGVNKALTAMLTSKPIKAPAAKRSGLVEAIVKPEDLLTSARALALEIAAGTKSKGNALTKSDKVPDVEGLQSLFDMFRMQTAAMPQFQHPNLCIDVVQYGLKHGGAKGLQKEQEVFRKTVDSEVCKSLVHIFLSRGGTAKVRGITDQGLKPRPLKTVGVIGGGLMGAGICTVCILAGYNVILKEMNQQNLDAGMKRIQGNIMSKVKKGKMDPEKAKKILSLAKGVTEYDAFAACDMVVEAVFESVELKQQIFHDLERVCPPHCILSTNTSTIDIDVCAGRMKDPSRIVGNHFFSPAQIMPLLEIVASKKTQPQVALDCLGFAKVIKKTPVVVGNCTGFAVNRVFFPYTMAATMLLDMGLDIYMIDKVIKKFGMPMGPFRLADLVGGDISLHVGQQFTQSYGDRVYGSAIIGMMNKAGRLGEKTGKGFYKFDEKRKASPAAEEVGPMIAESARASGLRPARFTPEEIVEFIFFPVVNEGCRVVAEGVVDKAADLDVATVLSMGFPAYRGGLIHWGDAVGARHIVNRLNEFGAMVGPKYAGFFKPCAYLDACAKQGVELGVGPASAKL